MWTTSRCLAVMTLAAVTQLPGPVSPEVANFAGNAQHTGIFHPAAVDLNAIRWSTTIDLRQTFGTTHYGSPLVTAANTLIVPVKTESDGFQIRAFNAATGKPRYAPINTDYVLPAHNWIPVYQPALATLPGSAGSGRPSRLYYPGAGGTLLYIDDPDSPKRRAPVRVAFYGLDEFERNAAAFTSTVFVNTPLTTDSEGNVFFGFRVQGAAPAPLNTTQSGFARIAPDGSSAYVLAGAAAQDGNITRDSHNSAPALSNDERVLYVVVKAGTTTNYAYLLGLDSTTLATRFKVFLKDPRNFGANNATVSDDSTASPMVAPDGDVYFGILAFPNNGLRGFLLRFSADLTVQKTPGGFGWDSTPAVVPASMVPSYTGPSSYLIFTKYNNYRFADGDGVNRIALLDPNSVQTDPHPSAGGLFEMREVLTIIGPTPDNPTTAFPNAVREWCINTAAVNPVTNSIFVPNEDGRLYRWDLVTNSLSQAVRLTPGFGEPYVPTIIGPDGTVFTLNGGTLFAVGTRGSVGLTMKSSRPDARSVVVGSPLTFHVTARRLQWLRTLPTQGSISFTDTYYRDQVAGSLSVDLGQAELSSSQATFTTATLPAGTHLITATHEPSGASVTLVQKIHAFPTTTTITRTPGPAGIVLTATVTAPVGVPTGMVAIAAGSTLLAQVPLNANGTASITLANIPLPLPVSARYVSDSLYASSFGCESGVPCSPPAAVGRK